MKGLVEEGALALEFVEADNSFPAPDLTLPPQSLNPSQQASADVLGEMLGQGGFQAALLDGVTGSGKTEVYLEAVAAALAEDPDTQVLILLPRSP